MADNLTNYAESALTKHLFGITEFTFPTTIRLALFTADPTETGSLANELDQFDAGYSRQEIVWSAESGGSVNNNAVITFPAITVPAVTITHVGVIDSATLEAGNLLSSSPLDDPKELEYGDEPKFAVGKFVCSMR